MIPSTPENLGFGSPPTTAECILTGDAIPTDTTAVALLRPRRERFDVFRKDAGLTRPDPIVEQQNERGLKMLTYIDHPTDTLWVHLRAVEELANGHMSLRDTVDCGGTGTCYVCGGDGATLQLSVDAASAPTFHIHEEECMATLGDRLGDTAEKTPCVLGAVL